MKMKKLEGYSEKEMSQGGHDSCFQILGGFHMEEELDSLLTEWVGFVVLGPRGQK